MKIDPATQKLVRGLQLIEGLEGVAAGIARATLAEWKRARSLGGVEQQIKNNEEVIRVYHEYKRASPEEPILVLDEHRDVFVKVEVPAIQSK